MVPLVSPAGSGTSGENDIQSFSNTLGFTTLPKGEGWVLRLALWESCRGATERGALLPEGGFSSSIFHSKSPRFYTFFHLPLKKFHDFCTLIAFGYEKTALTLEKTALTLEIFSIFL